MAITIELWEASGAVASPPGPSTEEIVTGISWRSSQFGEDFPYVDYPVRRGTFSYHKYHYFKIYGTYDNTPNDINVRFIGGINGQGVIGSPPLPSGEADELDLYYKFTNVYAEPTTTDLRTLGGSLVQSGTSLFEGSPPIPELSTTGPDGTFSFVETLQANTTYYTKYLVTQLHPLSDTWANYGTMNPNLKLELTMIEQKTGLPDWAPDKGQEEWTETNTFGVIDTEYTPYI